MIATVTLNPSLDKTVTVESLVMDESNRWTSLRHDPGGKGINVSRVIHRLGGDTVAYGFIGGFDGEILTQLLRQQGVQFDFTPIKEPIRSNFIITNLETRRQTRIDAPGPVVADNELTELTDRIDTITPRPDFLVFAGSVPPGVPKDIYRQFLEKANRQNIKTVLDSASTWLLEGIKARPTVIKPNVHEAEELLGRKLEDEAAIVGAVITLMKQGIEIVAISRGKEGLIIAGRGKVLKVIAPSVEVKSTVGAGDSTVAAMVLRLSQEASIEEASRWAVAAGTAATLAPGTELCNKDDVDRLLPEVEVRELHID